MPPFCGQHEPFEWFEVDNFKLDFSRLANLTQFLFIQQINSAALPL